MGGLHFEVNHYIVLMSFYKQKLERVQKEVYGNQRHLDAVIAIKNYIDKHLESKLDLDKLSEIHEISKYHLIRIFKRYYGITPKQYIISKRVEKSKELLKAGQSVTQTCFAVGFESLGSFSQLFKEKTGMSPHNFRTSNFQ